MDGQNMTKGSLDKPVVPLVITGPLQFTYSIEVVLPETAWLALYNQKQYDIAE